MKIDNLTTPERVRIHAVKNYTFQYVRFVEEGRRHGTD
jgi:hypothetical protein